MSTNSRKAKVTEESLAEALRLRGIWDSTKHCGQAEFGEQYGIGNQSAVGQYLRGEIPLNLKAAAGFAKGLGCTIADFSSRLADQACEYAALSGFDQSPLDLTQLSRTEMQHILLLRKITEEQKAAVSGFLIHAASIAEAAEAGATKTLDERTAEHFRNIAANEIAHLHINRARTQKATNSAD